MDNSERDYERRFGVGLTTLGEDSDLSQPGVQQIIEVPENTDSLEDSLEQFSEKTGKPVDEVRVGDIATSEELENFQSTVNDDSDDSIDVADDYGANYFSSRHISANYSLFQVQTHQGLMRMDGEGGNIPEGIREEIQTLSEIREDFPEIFAAGVWEVVTQEVITEYESDPDLNVTLDTPVRDLLAGMDIQRSLAETYEIQSGDCDDYAMATYEVLRATGIPASELVIMGGHARLHGQDETLGGHAVTVWNRPDGTKIIFDNLLDGPTELSPDFSYTGISDGVVVDLQFDPTVMYNEERVMEVTGYSPQNTHSGLHEATPEPEEVASAQEPPVAAPDGSVQREPSFVGPRMQ